MVSTTHFCITGIQLFPQLLLSTGGFRNTFLYHGDSIISTPTQSVGSHLFEVELLLSTITLSNAPSFAGCVSSLFPSLRGQMSNWANLSNLKFYILVCYMYSVWKLILWCKWYRIFCLILLCDLMAHLLCAAYATCSRCCRQHIWHHSLMLHFSNAERVEQQEQVFEQLSALLLIFANV